MFDTHITNTETNPVTRVVEKTITPDKVVDMYSRVRDELLASMEDKILVTSDIFSGTVTVYKDFHTQQKTIQTSFKLNRHLFQRFFTISNEETRLNKESLIKKLQEHYRDEVTKIILEKSFSAVSLT